MTGSSGDDPLELLYEARVEAYEDLGVTRSDAQGVVDAELMRNGAGWLLNLADPKEGVS